ncbi:MAG: hypothetical protein BM559_05260 [Roseobacter sp. MedPE-SWchi]|nr:MAG: hypothetical protein BM559_05260 [Roseobacter sp. MedPE-SWchi]
MSVERPEMAWADEVVAFLAENLPRDPEREGWNDMAMTAYQIACEAMIALGQAEARKWGAAPLADPVQPEVLPRWDDICIAVLGLAAQHRLLSYRDPSGGIPTQTIGMGGFVLMRGEGQSPIPEPNIGASAGLGPARATDDVLSVLTALGLVADGYWTSRSEVVLWREQPRTWRMEVTRDPRFQSAAEQAVETLPQEIGEEIAKLVAISGQDIDRSLAQHEKAIEELRLRHGPKARLGRSQTPGTIRKRLAFQRCGELDWVFFRRWRMTDVWLDALQARQALQIFHDPLAKQMRSAVLPKLYPELTDFH